VLVEPFGSGAELVCPAGGGRVFWGVFVADFGLDLVHALFAEVGGQVGTQAGFFEEADALWGVEVLVGEVVVGEDVLEGLGLHVVEVADELLVALACLDVELLAQDLEAFFLFFLRLRVVK